MTGQPKLTDRDIAALAAGVKAPESLHQRVQEMVADAQRPGAQRLAPAWRRMGRLLPSGAAPARRFAVAAAGISLAGAAALAIAIGLSGGGSTGLSARRAVALTLSPATMPAPAESSAHREQLAASVGGVAFPYWGERFGWRSSGARSDILDGRAVTTVFYSSRGGQRVGYAIVSGPAPATGGGTLVWRKGVSYRLSSEGGAEAILWRRHGRLCVIAGRGVSPRTLLDLASWGGERAHAV